MQNSARLLRCRIVMTRDVGQAVWSQSEGVLQRMVSAQTAAVTTGTRRWPVAITEPSIAGDEHSTLRIV